jgi:uncharacterized membrane protein YkgB
MLRTIVEAVVGVLMIILGMLFLIYIPNSPVNLATDLIFLGAGVLIIKRAYDINKKQKLEALAQSKSAKKQKQKPKNRSTSADSIASS